MFTISVQNLLPLQYIEISSFWVRGYLGEMAVYVTPDSHSGKHEDPSQWQLVYRKKHEQSPEDLVELKLGEFEQLKPEDRRNRRQQGRWGGWRSEMEDEEEGSIFEISEEDLAAEQQKLEGAFKPIRVKAGEGIGIYIHSKRPDDMAIVYDNQKSNLTYADRFIKVFPGLAHLSNQPFSGRGWGWGSWRQRREFVGKATYGCKYQLWQPHVHTLYPRKFREMVKTLLMVHRSDDPSSKFWIMPADTVLYILNLCHWQWAGDLDEEEDMSAEDKSQLAITSHSAYYEEWE